MKTKTNKKAEAKTIAYLKAKNRIRKLAWSTLGKIYRDGGRKVRRMIKREGERCGYRWMNLIVAQYDRRYA